jgi:hypothetical protein
MCAHPDLLSNLDTAPCSRVSENPSRPLPWSHLAGRNLPPCARIHYSNAAGTGGNSSVNVRLVIRPALLKSNGTNPISRAGDPAANR